MAGPAAAVCDNSACNFHDRLPVRIGHVCYQHLALFKIMDVFHVFNNIGNTLPDLGSDRLPGHNKIAGLLQFVSFHELFAGLRMNRFRPCLDNVQITGSNLLAVSVLGPFNVHGLLVMVFNNAGPFCKLKNLIIVKYILSPFFRSCVDIKNRFVRRRVRVVNHLYFLAANTLPDNRPFTLFQGRLEHIKLVRIDRPLDNILSQSPGAGQKNRILKTALSIN